jgi:hypothetical protein
MVLSKTMSAQIIRSASQHIGRPFVYETFNCVHFVREVYLLVGIHFPLLPPMDFPPSEFHLTAAELESKPLGHSFFLKRKEGRRLRIWSHVAIIYSPNEVIHCTRHSGEGVTVTPMSQLFVLYDLAQSH